ncbi:MAG: SGNH/GDSL hydrolase family protein [Burkholderiaceae bacterium]|nr:SGNH/GDSL hydrolase family protein [Burkholderiaceae bacterium]
MIQLRTGLAACALAALLAACGGGGSDTRTDTEITSVKVFGDSLADSGTFGLKFTVQGSASKIYPEHVAALYGTAAPCPVFLANDSGFALNPTPGCSNYAIGGGRINHLTAPTSPLSITTQLSLAGAAGNYSDDDLLLIDGGGNDAADLVGAYLKAAGGDTADYLALTGSLLDASTIATTLAQPNGSALLGGLYMQALAQRFHTAIRTHALDKGARHVVLLDIPAITHTPRFQMVLDGIAAQVAAGAGAEAGAAARQQSEALFRSWVGAFNDTLAALVRGDERVVLVQFGRMFDERITQPAQYGLSNVEDTACPATGLGGDGLPTYNFATCTDAALTAAAPVGAGGDWWQRYLFSDGFHPTPYGHQLVYQQISIDLARSGRL